MAIVTRLGKGSKLTIEEMDNNLLSLETDISGNVSAITSKLDKGTYTGTAKDLENAIVAAVTGASGISIVPTSPAPAGTGVASFTATQAGAYTNYGGVVVAANSFAIISRSAAGAFSISQTPFDLTTYAKLIDLGYKYVIVQTYALALLEATGTAKKIIKVLDDDIEYRYEGVIITSLLFPTNTLLLNTNNVWTSNGGGSWGAFGLSDSKLSIGSNGWIQVQRLADSKESMFGFSTTNTSKAYNGANGFNIAGVWLKTNGTLSRMVSNVVTDLGVTLAIGEYVRISRVGTVIKLQRSTDEITWTDIITYASTFTGDAYININIDSTGKLYYPKLNLFSALLKITIDDITGFRVFIVDTYADALALATGTIQKIIRVTTTGLEYIYDPTIKALLFPTSSFLVNTNNIWSSNGVSSFAGIGLSLTKLSSDQNGWIQAQYAAADAREGMFGFSTTNTTKAYNGANAFNIAGVWMKSGGQLSTVVSNVISATVATLVIGEYVRISRVGTVIKLQRSTDEITWTDITTYTSTFTGEAYININIDSTGKLYYPKFKSSNSLVSSVLSGGVDLDLDAFPDVIKVAVGRQMNIWYDSIPLGNGLGLTIDSYKNAGFGKKRDRSFQYTPTVVETNVLNFNIYNAGRIIGTKAVSVQSVLNSGAEGVTKNVLMIGDSMMSNTAALPTEFKTLCDASGDIAVNMLGTKGSNLNRYEATGGYKYSNYISNSSPFWNSSNSKVDFKNYMSVNSNFGFTNTIDYAIIMLGNNDVRDPQSIATIITNAKILIDRILDVTTGYPTCKIIIVPSPLTANSIAGWGTFGDLRISTEGLLRDLYKAMKTNFNNGIYNANVSLSFGSLFVDRLNGYFYSTTVISARDIVTVTEVTDAVHQNSVGSKQIADGIYSSFRSTL
jgi:hypothetical protein